MLIFLAEMKNLPSLPNAFQERMRVHLHSGFTDFINSLQQPSPISIRNNPSKSNHIEGASIPWTKFGRYLTERPVFTLDPNLHAGAYYVQEASSMLLEQALVQSCDLTKPMRVLDLCAAPGGKSTHIISLLSSDSLLVSNEVIRSRASILSENMQKWGYVNTIVTCNDPKDFQRMEGFFDVIVVDAPCSGEGLFRKDPESMNEWSPDNVQLCSLRQRRILSDVLPALKENGILIYSTCTYNEQENENNLVWLSKEASFDFIPLTLDDSWRVDTIQKENSIGYRCYPHQVKGEGFFVAILQKKSPVNPGKAKTKKRFSIASKKNTELLHNWVLNAEQLSFIQQENLLIAIPSIQIESLQTVSEQLNVITKGTAIAELKHEKLIPEHAFALSTIINQGNFNRVPVGLNEALHYLKKEPFPCQSQEKGFALVTYQTNPLGWINLLGSRFNNLYPVNWRIRMNI